MALITDTSISFLVSKLSGLIILFNSTNMVRKKVCIMRGRVDNASVAFLKSVSLY